MRKGLWLWTPVLAAMALGCRGTAKPEVVIYTSVDQVYAEPVLRDFEAGTGIRALAVYDVEAAKSTGLANRMLAERQAPRADVFWSSEVSQTLRLARSGVLASYYPPTAADVPQTYRDREGFWTGMGLRGRIFLCNTDRVPSGQLPKTLDDLLSPRWQPGDIGIANPLFGTSATHMAALYAALGPERAVAFYRTLRDRGARVLDGNSVVRDLVARGDLAVGLTDTDDAQVALDAGAPVEVAYPGPTDEETLYIPNTIAVTNGGQHPVEARRLADFLCSEQTERRLIAAKFLSASVRKAPKGLEVLWREVERNLDRARGDASNLFLQ